jgi:hypothetical protein
VVQRESNLSQDVRVTNPLHNCPMMTTIILAWGLDSPRVSQWHKNGSISAPVRWWRLAVCTLYWIWIFRAWFWTRGGKMKKKPPSQNCPFSSRNYWYGTLYFESKRPTSFPFLFCIWCACTWLDPLACKRYIAAFFVCISHSAIDLSQWLKNMLFLILIHLRIQEAWSSLSLELHNER